MRWLLLPALLLVAAPAHGQQNEAEKLFRAMEKKIRSAKSLQLTFAGELTGDGVKVTFKGTAYLAAGDKLRLEADNNLLGKDEKMLLISDGTSMYAKAGDKVDPKPQPPEPGLYEKASSMIPRLGMTGAFYLFVEFSASTDPPKKKEAFVIETKLPVKDFKLGPKEKVGQRDAQVVEYTIDLGGKPAKIAVSIDVQSQMPLKFVVVAEEAGKQVFRLVETISVTVDGKLDSKLFEIPK
jgi:outer membrane lipoprotein-sorting protein